MKFDGKAFGEEMVAVVRSFVEREAGALRAEIARDVVTLRGENEALVARNAELEARIAAVEGRDLVAAFLPQIEAMNKHQAAEIEALRQSIPNVPEPPDLSGFAAKGDVDAMAALAAAELSAAVDDLRASIPEPVDLSRFATVDQVAAARAAIPDVTGFALKSDVDAVSAAIPEPVDLSIYVTTNEANVAMAGVLDAVSASNEAVAAKVAEIPSRIDALTNEIAEVRSAIPAMPDLAPFATKAEVAEAVAAIVIPEAINGEDADPEIAAEIALARIEERLSEADRRVSDAVASAEARISERLAEVRDGRDGKDGLLPVAAEWSDRVHRSAEVVTYKGALWQARQDTGKEPPHADWICLAARGDDGLTPEFVGTYDPEAEVRRLDVVALNGGSFVALRDNPGPCPGEGWQLVAGRGKPGQAIKGDKGDAVKGDPGNDATEVAGLYRDGGEIVLTLADGREFRA